VNTDAAGNFAL